MMFSRDELGKLFQDRFTAGALSGDKSATAKSNIPKLPTKADVDLAGKFNPSALGIQKPGRYWAGKAPGAADVEDESDVFRKIGIANAAQGSRTSAGQSGGSRRRVDAEVVGDDETGAASSAAAPARRRMVEAEVIEEVDDDDAGHAASSSAAHSVAPLPQHAEDEDTDEQARRARVRERLAARRAVEAEVVEEQPGPSDALLSGLDSDDISARVAAALEAARAKAQPAEPEVQHAAGGAEARPSQAAAGGDDVDEDVAARRARIRERMRAREAAAEVPDSTGPAPQAMPEPPVAAAPGREVAVDGVTVRVRGLPGDGRPGRAVVQAEVVEDEDGQGDGEDEDEEDGATAWGSKPLFRPVFRSKDQRSTLREAEAKAAEEEAARAREAAQAEARAVESRAMVVEALRQEEAEAAAGAENDVDGTVGKPDDTDRPEDEEAEYHAWKIRELKRLARDALAAEEALKEQQETERRRGLTPEERAREDAALEAQGLKVFRKTKEKWGFLQKYYHKGVFYVDEASVKDKDDVRLRSVAQATGEDAILGDKAALPRVMQVKNFGRKGRTKWTHLAAEDTTASTKADEYYHVGRGGGGAGRGRGGYGGSSYAASGLQEGRRGGSAERGER